MNFTIPLNSVEYSKDNFSCEGVFEYVLCSESEGSAGDGGRQVQALRDLPPQLFIYDLHQPPLLCHQLVQHVEVQHLLGHDGNPVHWRPCTKTISCVEHRNSSNASATNQKTLLF